MRRVKNEEVYICGAALLSEKKPVSFNYRSSYIAVMQFVTHGSNILFNNSINVLTGLPEVCYHCGSENQLANNQEMELKSRFAKVRPICCACFIAGKEPATWGPKNNSKRKRV